MKIVSPNLPPGFRVTGLRPHLNELKNEARRVAGQLAADPPRQRGGNDVSTQFPFRLYVLPPGVRGSVSAADWRKISVRAGLVGRHEVTGTDGVSDPYSAMLPEDASNEVTVPTGQEKHYFWIAITPGAGGSIEHSDDPEENGWPGFDAGTPCTTEGTVCRLIGWVDTSTDETQKLVRIRQILCADEPDWYQACVNVGGVEKVINVACDGQPFDFV